ncbi:MULTISPECIES: hypothetical protein [unclassified Bradyrhizobium]|uniref:hypothetical protein n=1 Tax=unclassified Bradyrhizobium TaxID=2631580 RepID=UPI0029161D19|nr:MULTISPECIES: hypothetical protein [unclassified Bradyrhizobium]
MRYNIPCILVALASVTWSQAGLAQNSETIPPDLVVLPGDLAGSNLDNGKPGQSSEDRAQSNHEAIVDSQLDRTESKFGDGARLKQEQQYRRTHK